MADTVASEDRVDFSAPYDGVTKVISIGFCVFQLILIAAIHNVFVNGSLILIALITYAYSPQGYTVTGRSIIVKRLIGNIRVPLDNLREARRIRPDDLRYVIRLWASGGLFGYFGLYRTSRLGKCTWYATDRKNTVVLIGAKKTTVFSPGDVDGFLQAIRAQVPVPVTAFSDVISNPAVSATSAPGTLLWVGIIAGIVAAFGALAGILALLTYARRGIH
jgi:hypothetical protein